MSLRILSFPPPSFLLLKLKQRGIVGGWGRDHRKKKIKASLRRAGNARGLSMGFFRMQNCRLAHSIEEREGAAAGFQLRCRRRRRCRRRSGSPWVPAAHHWALGGRAGGRQGGGQAQSQCRIADFSCAGFFFFFFNMCCNPGSGFPRQENEPREGERAYHGVGREH